MEREENITLSKSLSTVSKRGGNGVHPIDAKRQKANQPDTEREKLARDESR